MGGRIVLFGGTFDPIHFGHLITARAVAEKCGFDRITFMPAATPPHKATPQASGDHRLAMVQLATAGDDLWDTCRLELDRGGASYTYQAVRALSAGQDCQEPPCLVIGADMLAALWQWRQAEELVETARIVVAARPPWNREKTDAALAGLAGRLPADAIDRIAGDVVASPLIDISSSDIRRRVAEGRSIRYLTPDSVISYISARGLYR